MGQPAAERTRAQLWAKLGHPGLAGASTLTFKADATWKTTTGAPTAGWNTSAGYDDSGWSAAAAWPNFYPGFDGIWDPSFAAQFYARKTFTLDQPPAMATLSSVIDDDMDLYVNGTLVVSDHDGLMGFTNGMNIAHLLKPGENVIAVRAINAQGNWGLGVQIDVTLPDIPAASNPSTGVPVDLEGTYLAARNVAVSATTDGGPIHADLNGDGKVDAADEALLNRNMGRVGDPEPEKY